MAKKSAKYVVFALTTGRMAGMCVISSTPGDIARKKSDRGYKVVLETNDRHKAEQAVIDAALA